MECILGNASVRRRRKQLHQLKSRLEPLEKPTTCQSNGHATSSSSSSCRSPLIVAHDDYRLDTLASLDDNVLDKLTYSVLNRHLLFRSSATSSTNSASSSSTHLGSDVAKCFCCPSSPAHLLADLFAWFRKTPTSNRDQLKQLSFICSTEKCCNPFHYALVSVAG